MKRILYIISIIALYELSKYITEQIIVYLDSIDDIDIPRDYCREVGK